MKKIFSVLIAFAAVCSIASASAKDVFLNYNDCVADQNLILNIGGGLDYDFVNHGSGYKKTPTFDLTLEHPFPISDKKLPFGFGGGLSFSHETYDGYHYDESWNYLTIFGLVNYHINVPAKNLDIYAGLRSGLGIWFWSVDYERDYYTISDDSDTEAHFFIGTYVGASYYFTDLVGVNVEVGYPYLIKAAVSLKF